MIFLNLHRKVPEQNANANETAKEEEAKEPVRKILNRVKVMTMVKATPEVERESRRLSLLGSQNAKQGSRVSSLIRLQLEEVKRKVGASSPAALQFIGPGDREITPTLRGGITI
ncbi:hypothetical protein [Mesobacillus foraminis]|uniref:Uncharacterized protein n=1 Tax=Mesobacillus foraminis TaxID=279826 RepID=A0A4R2BHM0_9BACI|nr:hypothetical protein [Mesobacillus foraminis]TCN26531.1 hypothetical protein EV146_10352 [Mesobacillus foraminis]